MYTGEDWMTKDSKGFEETIEHRKAWRQALNSLRVADQTERCDRGLSSASWPRPSTRAVIDAVAKDMVTHSLGAQGEKDLLDLRDAFSFLSPDDPLNAYYRSSKERYRAARIARTASEAGASPIPAERSKCPYCQKVYSDDQGLQTHLFDVSGKSNHPVYDIEAWIASERAANRAPCAVCWRSFTEEWKLESHLTSMAGRKGHPDLPTDPSTPDKFVCAVCWGSPTHQRVSPLMSGLSEEPRNTP